MLCHASIGPARGEPRYASKRQDGITRAACTYELEARNICGECWREWIGMGTKVINELRLPLSDPQAQKIWDQHIAEFLNLEA